MQIRSIISLFTLLILLSVAVGGTIYFRSLKEAVRSDIVGDADADIQNLADRIAVSLSESQRISAALAGLKELRVVLTMTNAETLRHANAILDLFRSTIEADVCYLIDRTGNTIASSNRNTSESFVGENYAFRPYFQDAVSGTPAIYPAVGVVTKKRGLFYSYPVYGVDIKQPVGVLVIKRSTEPIEREINVRHEGIMMLTDPHGIVLISSRQAWLYHSIWRIQGEVLAAVKATRQFGQDPIGWLGIERKDADEVIDSEGKQYLIKQKDIANLPGWKVVFLLDSRILSRETSARVFNKFGSLLVVFSIVVGLGVFLLYIKADQAIRKRKFADENQKRSMSLLQATLESTADGILVVDREGKFAKFNARFSEMLRLPDDILSSGDDSQALKFVLDQLSDPQGFLSKVTDLYAHPEEESIDVLEFKDGRVFERCSKPQWMSDRIVGRVWSFRDVTERTRLTEQLRALSLTDELTGLYNRRGFFTLVEHLLKVADRSKKGIFLLYADLDGLKKINDTFGHKEGDSALSEIANLLRENYRKSDVIARIGGDEFVVIPVGFAGDDVEVIYARLKKSLDIHNTKMNRSYKLSLSAGIAYYNPENPCSVDELLVQADNVMYKQKRQKKS